MKVSLSLFDLGTHVGTADWEKHRTGQSLEFSRVVEYGGVSNVLEEAQSKGPSNSHGVKVVGIESAEEMYQHQSEMEGTVGVSVIENSARSRWC